MRKSLLTQRIAFMKPGLGFMAAKAYLLRDRFNTVSNLVGLQRHPHVTVKSC